MTFEKRYCQYCGKSEVFAADRVVEPRWYCDRCGKVNIGGQKDRPEPDQ